MATSIDQIKGFLDEFELKYVEHEEEPAIAISFASEPHETAYRDTDGDPCLQMVIAVFERGEFVAVFAPEAWNIRECEHKGCRVRGNRLHGDHVAAYASVARRPLHDICYCSRVKPPRLDAGRDSDGGPSRPLWSNDFRRI